MLNWIQRLEWRLPPCGSPASYLAALALTAVAIAVRLIMAPVDVGLQYLTLFPAVILAAVVGGFGPGILATVLGTILGFHFSPPHLSFSIASLTTNLWPDFVFCLAGLIVCLAIETLHRYRVKYVTELTEVRKNAARIARINDALLDSEAFSLSVFNARREQVAVLDEHGVIVAVNEGWRRFARENGAPELAEASVGLNYLTACANAPDHLHGTEASGAAAGIRAILRGTMDEFTLEYPCHSPEEDRWLNMRVTPLSGSRRGALVAHENITKRKQMEKALMHHAAIIESSADAIIGKTLEGFITIWNRGAEQVFGYGRDEVLGQHISLVIPEPYRDHERKVLAEIANGVALKHYQTVRRRKDGSLIDISVTISPLRDAMGKIVGASKVARDITEQKRAEQELRIAATAFEAQEGMIIADANNIILRVNRAFTRSTGYASEEAVGRHVRLLKSGRHDAAFYAEMWKTVRREGSWQGEIWNRRKNGEVYPEWLTITAVKNRDGEITHYVGTHTDITSRKAAEDEIKHLAFYDPLTRLPNRRLLMDRLHQALATSSRTGREGALLFIDLDNFKTLNDSLGHDMGDLLLQEVALRLSACVREGDTVSRLGGDEFVVVLEVLSETSQEARAQAEGVGSKMLAAIGQPYMLAGHEFHSTPSIGITLFGRRERSPVELLKEADLAMYRAKAAGRNTLRFLDPADG
ncbi:MAG: PAS domain S-box protein [Rhodocyclaceae bacterium]|nr:PAS domain S-box protein [Rhodocyclaceae bacterium]